MNSKNKNFKGQFDDEQVLCYFRKHWVALIPRLIPHLIGSTFIFIFLVLAIRYFKELNSQNLLILGAAIVMMNTALIYMVHRQFLAVFRYYLHAVLITNYRVVILDKSVFFQDSKNSVDLSKIQDIRKKQTGVLANVLNYGSLVIILSGTYASVDIDLVPRPEYQFKKINEVKQAYWPEQTGAQPFGQKPLPSEEDELGQLTRKLNNPYVSG